MLGRRNSLAKERRSIMKCPDFSWCMLGLDLVPQIWKKHGVEFLYTHKVQAIVSFPGGKKKSMCVAIIIMLRTKRL